MDWNGFSQTDIEFLVSPQILERGLNYLHQGQLIQACRFGEILAGVIIGTGGDYRVRLWFEGLEVRGDCTCPYNGFCKHMVALAIGWLEKPSVFINLQPIIDQVLADQAKMSDVLLKMVEKDPVHFLELSTPATSSSEFITAKGLLNLVRNTFSFPRITKNEIEQLWEQTIRLQKLLLKAFADSEPESPLLIGEFLSGLELMLEEGQNEFSNELFNDFLTDLIKVSSGKSIVFIEPIIRKLMELYLNPKLFQLTPIVRNTFIVLIKHNPELVSDFFHPKINTEFKPFQLILIYELFSQLVEEDSDYQAELEKIIPVLTESSEGRLWSIDRWMENNLEKAFKLAKEGLWLFPEDKRFYRERLIKIHMSRYELRQAASLSFIQFQCEPNLAEYLRLKDILKNYPNDWQSYAKKITELLIHRDEKLLIIEIAITEQDHESIKQYLPQIIEDESLLSAVKLLSAEVPEGLCEIYPTLIMELLNRELFQNWGLVIELLMIYKKYCYQHRQRENWDDLREQLERVYGGDIRFKKKLGSLLLS